MIIQDLFSHKIHSSGDDWPDKLVEIAAIFSEFDGKLYNREAIEARLKEISPRAACVSRDQSKFRDEISAYPAFLGLYHLFPSKTGWIVKLSKTAKNFLLKEEPDVASFMRLQLTIFQYPNGIGAAYKSLTSNVRIQANARDRTLLLIKHHVHISPLRLLVVALKADAELKRIDQFKAAVSFAEIYLLANDSRTNKMALPSISACKTVLQQVRAGIIQLPKTFERRFHILKHTDMFSLSRGAISFRQPVNIDDANDLLSKIHAISNVSIQFEGFDDKRTGSEIENVIAQGDWGNYFDGLSTLSGDVSSILSNDIIENDMLLTVREMQQAEEIKPKAFPLLERKQYSPLKAVSNRKLELADPEVTKIKRQKRNLAHKILIDKMCDYISKLRAFPLDNPHIDLYAEIPNDGSFLFEMKSGGENLLDQLRKGVSQLYEYRFRYKKVIRQDTTLCLVIPSRPANIPWIFEYLCVDRQICICWFDEHNNLVYPLECQNQMGVMHCA